MTKTRFAGVATRRGQLPVVEEPSPSDIAAKTTGRPPGKKTDPNYVQVTVYLRKDVHHAARKTLFDSRRQFSDLVNELVNKWLDSQKSVSSDV